MHDEFNIRVNVLVTATTVLVESQYGVSVEKMTKLKDDKS